MQSKLDAAMSSLERDNTAATTNQIHATILQIHAILNQKKTTTETDEALTSLQAELEAVLALF